MKILITGGAGFIGTNAAAFYLSNKNKVTIFDNFSRKGTELNASFISRSYPSVKIVKGDVRNFEEIKKHVKDHDVIIHLAGQVAVTTSIAAPRDDFESNVLGTFNVLEAARLSGHKPGILYSSTNKVYGDFAGSLVKKEKRYEDRERPLGISEDQLLDFHSPYGCSKGAADQYVRDYSRIFDIPTVVFRQSCIYGTHQFGVEDQGWVAHFAINALLKRPITIYGNGYQVRDILFIDDLINAYDKVIKDFSALKGEIFNIGGGRENTVSLLELIAELEKALGHKIEVAFKEKRPGDQDLYVSDIRKAGKILDWKPGTDVPTGVSRLIEWMVENRDVLASFR